MFRRVEASAMALISFLAATVIAAYAAGTIGLAVHPFVILPVALAAGAIAARSLWPGASASRSHVIAFIAVVAGVLTWAVWLAWPHLLPAGRGPDLTHHLLLIDYIERTGHLPRDAALGPYLGEMLHYTPGSHLLVVLAGRWIGSDGLHAAHVVIAVTVALKAGLVLLIALRCLPKNPARTPIAVVAVLLLFLPDAYFVASFTQDWFLAQLVSEVFAVAMWWAIVAWDRQPSMAAAAMFGIAGTAAFLSWPVWVGPLTMTLAVVALFRIKSAPATTARHLAAAFGPIAAIAMVHTIGHYGGAGIARTSGAVVTPSAGTLGVLFITLGLAGTVIATFDTRSRTAAVLTAAIAVQSAALFVLARTSHAQTPYLSLKMVYLAIYPLAVAGAVGVAWVLRLVRGSTAAAAIGWGLVLALGIAVARQLGAAPRPVPVITDSLHDAGRWARAHLPNDCVDYVVADDDSAYWLHLAVLHNARSTRRSTDNDTYAPRQALIRWVLPGGLPYAIADPFDNLPKDIQTNVDVLARFGTAAVVKRRGAAVCAP